MAGREMGLNIEQDLKKYNEEEPGQGGNPADPDAILNFMVNQ